MLVRSYIIKYLYLHSKKLKQDLGAIYTKPVRMWDFILKF